MPIFNNFSINKKGLALSLSKGFTTFSFHERGFTLIELLVTISIISILSAIGLLVYSDVVKQGRDSKRQSDLLSIQSALEQYFTDQFYYPAALNFGSGLSEGSKVYMNIIPKDPLPDGHPKYCYKPLKQTQTCSLLPTEVNCSNSSAVAADRCVSYCLYAKLENLDPVLGTECGSTTNYNLTVTPP